MCSYFLKYIHKAQYLDYAIPEPVLVSTILRHFPPGIRRNLHLSNCDTISVALEQLRILEADPDLSSGIPLFNSSQNKPTQPTNLASSKKPYGVHQVDFDFSVPPPTNNAVDDATSLN